MNNLTFNMSLSATCLLSSVSDKTQTESESALESPSTQIATAILKETGSDESSVLGKRKKRSTEFLVRSLEGPKLDYLIEPQKVESKQHKTEKKSCDSRPLSESDLPEMIGDRYAFLCKLGSGCQGSAGIYSDIHTGEELVIKVSSDLEKAKNEVKILKRLQMKKVPNVVQLVDAFKLKGQIAIVTKNAGDTVEYLLEELSLSESIDILKQLLIFIKKIDELNFVNNDFNVANLCYHEGKITVLDWAEGEEREPTSGFSKNMYDVAELVFELFTHEILESDHLKTFVKNVRKQHPELEKEHAKALYLLLCDMYKEDNNISSTEALQRLSVIFPDPLKV